MNDYKSKEIKFLKKICSDDISYDCKYTKIKQFVLLNTNKFPVRITNNDVESTYIFKNKNITYSYSYSRFDGYINYSTMLNDFYGVKYNKFKTKVFFTNSGMSAISSVLNSINLVYKDYNFIFDKEDIYFETYDYINKCLKNNTNKSSNKILYIDSICKKYSENDISNLDYNKIRLIIFDTTCFASNSMQKTIKFLISKKIPVILVRSHTKLDMLGTELTSMGSIIYIIPDHLEPNNKDNIFELIKTTFYILGKFNSLLSINNFYEIIFNKDFIHINSKRIANIENNNKKLFFQLKEKYPNINLIIPTHQKFLIFVPSVKYNNVSEQLSKYKEKLRLFCNSHSGIFYSGSFGFDYVSMDVYYDLDILNFVIRVSMNDMDDTSEIIDNIEEFINDNI